MSVIQRNAKVKVHRGGDPLNEEVDIKAVLGRLKEYKETIWNDSSVRLRNCASLACHLHKTRGDNSSQDFGHDGPILCAIKLGRKREK